MWHSPSAFCCPMPAPLPQGQPSYPKQQPSQQPVALQPLPQQPQPGRALPAPASALPQPPAPLPPPAQKLIYYQQEPSPYQQPFSSIHGVLSLPWWCKRPSQPLIGSQYFQDPQLPQYPHYPSKIPPPRQYAAPCAPPVVLSLNRMFENNY